MADSTAIAGFKKARETVRSRDAAIKKARSLGRSSGSGTSVGIRRTSSGGFEAVKVVTLPESSRDVVQQSRITAEQARQQRIQEIQAQQAQQRETAAKIQVTQTDSVYSESSSPPPTSVDRFISTARGAVERQRELTKESREKDKSPLIRTARRFGEIGIGFVSSGLDTFETAVALKRQPVQTTKDIGKGLYEIGRSPVKTTKKVVASVKKEPFEATGGAISDLLFIKGASRSVKVTRTAGGLARAVTSPKFIASEVTESGARVIKGIPTSKGAVDIEITGTLVKGDPRPTVLRSPIGEQALRTTPLESLRKQVKLAGQEVTGVSGARDFIGMSFSGFEATKRTVKRLATGQNLRQRLGREILIDKQGTNPLEQGFFIDPAGRLRPSRLGIGQQSDASLSDIVRGRFTFFKDRPQGILFPQTPIASFPKGLKDIERALRKGKTLTEKQRKRLLKWQLTGTGEFKPIGYLSTEVEATIPKGSVIRKKKKSAVTIIGDRRVEIFESEIVKGAGKVPKAPKSPRLTSQSSSYIGSKPLLPVSKPASSAFLVTPSATPKSQKTTSSPVSSPSRILSPFPVSSPVSSPVSRSPVSKSPFSRTPISSPISSPPISPSLITPPSSPPSSPPYSPPSSPPSPPPYRPPRSPSRTRDPFTIKVLRPRRQPKSRYAPSLLGLELGETISKAPKVTTAVGIRLPVKSKKRRKKSDYIGFGF